jgi:hypothetical protein
LLISFMVFFSSLAYFKIARVFPPTKAFMLEYYIIASFKGVTPLPFHVASLFVKYGYVFIVPC